MKKITYTKKLHAYRVSLMIEKIESGKFDIDGCCPAMEGFNFSFKRILNLKGIDTCPICKEFLGISKAEAENWETQCPCFAFGSKEALTKTKKALKEYYKK